MTQVVVEPSELPPRRRLWRAASLMGPAFIAGAWQFGPGNLTSAAQAGGRFGYDLIWLVVVSTILMLIFTDMSVRIGLVSSYSLIETIKRNFGVIYGVGAGIGVFIITLMFSVGNAVGTGLGLSMLFGGPHWAWTIGCSVLVALLVQGRGYYKIFERLVLCLVVVMGIGFVITALLSRPDWEQAAGGFIPSLPPGVGVLLIALIGTNFSINAAFYTGYATRERGLQKSQYHDLTLSDTIPGIVAPGVMTILVMAAGAAALNQSDEDVDSIQKLASVLEPVIGSLGGTVFALGFAGAAFSAMITNATAGGSLLADGMGLGNSLGNPRVKLPITAVLAFGAIVAAIANTPPVQLIIVAQALTVVVTPFLGLLLVLLANHRRLMGDFRNRWWQNVIAALGLAAVFATCHRLIVSLYDA